MARSGFFTGLDIGTDSIKVLVAEFVNGTMNVIGVSTVPSLGVKDGIIVDIDSAAKSIHQAIGQAEEKAGITIQSVTVGLPSNQLQIDQTQGMVSINTASKEIRDGDVENVITNSLSRSLTPEREVVAMIPEEFIIDGFKGIRDPRGMMGTRLEVKGWLYTGPSTVLHNLRKAVERAEVSLENIVVANLSLAKSILNEGEREFGATVIDMGAGQTSVVAMRDQEVRYSVVYPEAGEYVTKDISKVLRVSLQTAENLKYNFGSADINEASPTESVQVEVVGGVQPIEVTERYLAEIISARLRQIFERVRDDLARERILEYPGGIVLTGGGAILPGVTELAQEVFGTPVKLYVPNQVGIRNPIFSNVISLVEYAGNISEVELLSRSALVGEEMMRRKPVDYDQSVFEQSTVQRPAAPKKTVVEPTVATPVEDPQPTTTSSDTTPKEPKKKIGDRVRGLFGNMFD